VSEAQLDELLRSAIDEGVFPGCVALVWRDGEVRYFGAHGQLASHAEASALHLPVTADTVYDLASLTKILATTTLIAQAVGQGQLSLDQPLPASLALRTGERPRLRELLEHAAGLAAHREFFFAPWSLGPNQREALIEAVRGVALERPPGREAVYSDLGFLLLGAWLEQLHGARLDALFSERIAEPLGIADAIGFAALDGPERFDSARVAATEVYTPASASEHWHPIRAALGQRFAHAIVHDDNAVVMAGVAGHAGLFGTAAGVLAIARAWLERRIPGVPAGAQAGIVADFTRPSQVPGSTRRLGFDGPSPDASGSTGSALSGSAFGHLGFTGTSVWIDPDAGPSHVTGRGAIELLLSNRVHPSRHDSRIRAIRPRFHTLAAGC
jgi:serine-type D-Ala-D-Ala carboxypeptidase